MNTHTAEGLQPYEIPQITALQATVSRQWYSSEKKLQFSANNLKFTLSSQYTNHAANHAPAELHLTLTLGRTKLWISLPQSFIQDLLHSLDDEININDCNYHDIALLLELFFSSFFSGLEEQKDTIFSLEFGDHHIPAEKTIQLSGVVEVSNSDNAKPFLIILSEQDYTAWETMLNELSFLNVQNTNKLEALIPINLGINCKSISLDLQTVRSLSAGDMILLGSHENNKNSLEVAVGHSTLWLASPSTDGNSLEIKQTLLNQDSTRQACNLSGENIMTEKNNNNASLDEIPLTVSFEVGRKTISIEQLREIKEGSVITFANDKTDDVQIVINGREVGYGTLVKVDESIAVKVEQVFTNG